MSKSDELYELAAKDVSLAKVYNQYMSNPAVNSSDEISEYIPLISMIEGHVNVLNTALQKDKKNKDAYTYLSDRIIYWSNILVHEFDYYVNFNIPSPCSLFQSDGSCSE